MVFWMPNVHQGPNLTIFTSPRLGPTVNQEWCLIRFPFSTTPPRPPPPLAQSSDGIIDTLVRGRYKLQNVASGQFMTATTLDTEKDEPNIVLKDDSLLPVSQLDPMSRTEPASP